MILKQVYTKTTNYNTEIDFQLTESSVDAGFSIQYKLVWIVVQVIHDRSGNNEARIPVKSYTIYGFVGFCIFCNLKIIIQLQIIFTQNCYFRQRFSTRPTIYNFTN